MNDPTAQSLHAIRRELTQTLDGLRSALEAAVDERPDRETLRRCAERLDLARGGLQRVDARGAVVLVEEMAAVCRHLPGVASRQARETGVETLTDAVVELAAHLDRPLGAHRDVTPALLPLINRLRAVSGRQRLSEAPWAGLDEPAATVTAPPDEALRSAAGQARFRDTARTLRPAFQVALLGCIRDEHATAHLAELARVSRALEEAATSDSVRQLWYVLTVVLRGLAEDGCEPTVAVKRLLGQADRQLKRLIDEGDASFVESPPVELIDHLMHYVAESAAGPPVAGAEPKTAPLPTPPVMVFDAVHSDPALVELFIEQAKEEMAKIDRNLPAWRADAASAEARLALQGAFHRLSEGSRMAGARLIGEYAGRIERLLDRIARQVLEPTEPVRAFVATAAAALPELLEQLEVGTRPQADIALLMQRAEAFAPGAPPAAQPHASARVDAGRPGAALDGAGEIASPQTHLQRQLHSIDLNLNALTRAVTRLREQLFDLADETGAPRRQHGDGASGSEPPAAVPEAGRDEAARRLSRALTETVNEVADIGDLLRELSRETDTRHSEQAGAGAALQDGLMPAPAVPFERCVSRLAGIVEEAAAQSAKAAELVVEGAEAELDGRVIERLVPAFEHLLRHAVIHGIEEPAARQAAGKPGAGRITVTLQREGPEVVIELADDGAGLGPAALRREASGRGLAGGRPICTEDARQLVLEPGLTAADEASRGVGLDVVDGEVKRLGGSLRIEAEAGRGTRFIMRLPCSLATDALIVRVGEATFALPLSAVEGMTRIAKDRLLQLLAEDEPRLEHSGVDYRVEHLGALVDTAPSALPDDDSPVCLVLVRAGDSAAALITDALEGSREVVVETPGPHIGGVPGVTGAAALSDGRLVMVLDIGMLVRARSTDVGRSTGLAAG